MTKQVLAAHNQPSNTKAETQKLPKNVHADHFHVPNPAHYFLADAKPHGLSQHPPRVLLLYGSLREAWVIHISVAGHDDKVAAIPAQSVHLSSGHRQVRRWLKAACPVFVVIKQGLGLFGHGISGHNDPCARAHLGSVLYGKHFNRDCGSTQLCKC